MPRKILGSKKKCKRKQWDKENMVKAIQAVRNKEMGLKKATKYFSVPRPTLQRLARLDKTPKEAAEFKLGRKPVMCEELERELVEYLLLMESKFYGLTRQDVRRVAYQLCERNNINHPFSEEGLAGRAWFDHFMNRHKDVLSILKPTATSFSRANGFNKEAINNFFDILESEYAKHKYPADRVFNVDETGISVVPSKVPRVIGLKGKRQVGAISSAERGSLVTVVCCMSAGGTFVPPLFIFPRKNMSQLLIKGAPPGSIGRCHPSGWIQSNIFTDWLKHFIEKTKPSQDDPVLLILDGHNTHTKNMEVVDLARDNGISIVSLPPHTSHKMQPLDRTFISPLKHHYSENIRQWMRHSDRPFGPYDIAELLGKAYLTCQAGSIAVNGFKITGIFPCNRNVFTAVDFAPSSQEELDLTFLKSGIQKRKLQRISTTSSCDQEEETMGASFTQGGGQNMSATTTKEDLNPTGTANSRVLEAVQVTQHQASAADEVLAGPSGLSNHNAKKIPGHTASPKDIWPVPKPKKKVTNKGPKASKAALITSSPYRNALLAAEGAKKRKEQAKTKKSVKRRIVEESEEELCESDIDSGESVLEAPIGGENPGQEDAACLFCDGLFSADKCGELWVQCIICEMWAHNECAGCEKDVYVCDFCK